MRYKRPFAVLSLLLAGVLLAACSAPRTEESETATLRPIPPLDENDHSPRWSPDGTKIAFRSDRDGNSEFYVMNADGSDVTRLTHHPAFDGEIPVWSPDGATIVFYSDRDGQREIYVIDADGANPTRLTHNEADDYNAHWSPDGSKIVFASRRDGDRELYVMDADGANPTRLTVSPGYDGYPAWSPDGARIAFISFRDAGYDGEIYVMNADGSEPTRLTHTRGWDFDPAWSPDGSRIVFNSRRDGRRGTYIMNADGSNQTKLTNKALSTFITIAREKGVDRAIERYRAATTALPDTVFFLPSEVHALAYALLDDGHTDDALKLFELNTEAYPTSTSVFVTLGTVYTHLQNKQQAVQAYERAVALSPENDSIDQLLKQAQAD